VAEQLEFFPVQSPCRGICQTDERGYCRGCFRSREERFNWQTMSDAQKQEVCVCAANGCCAKYARTGRSRRKNRSNPHCFKPKITYTQSTFLLRKRLWFSVLLWLPRGRNFRVL
jgi:predicted Fe-S protein YdhL (DUF1289 family)